MYICLFGHIRLAETRSFTFWLFSPQESKNITDHFVQIIPYLKNLIIRKNNLVDWSWSSLSLYIDHLCCRPRCWLEQCSLRIPILQIGVRGLYNALHRIWCSNGCANHRHHEQNCMGFSWSPWHGTCALQQPVSSSSFALSFGCLSIELMKIFVALPHIKLVQASGSLSQPWFFHIVIIHHYSLINYNTCLLFGLDFFHMISFFLLTGVSETFTSRTWRFTGREDNEHWKKKVQSREQLLR